MTARIARVVVLLACCLGALVALGTRRAVAEGSDAAELATAVERADTAFRAAQSADGVAARAAAFRVAAQAFEDVAAAGHVNAALEYNTGNAWLLAGDVGRAILHYRRALLLRPGDPETLSNLTTARSRRRDQIDEAAGRAVLETVFFWHAGLSHEVKRVAGATP